jgi:4-amino-4-deoxy-L-arabinose transferase-like glycosyltransferase
MKQVNQITLLLALILLSALALRIWGIGYDLPYIYHPDEPNYITISQNIFKTGDLNPHFFSYPSLFFYINAFAYLPYYLLGKIAGVFQVTSDILAPVSLAMAVTHTQLPSTVWLGRVITLCFGISTVGLVYITGKQISNRFAVGVLAALMFAILPTAVSNSRLITPDTFVTFFALLAFWASVQVYQQGKTWQYILAGLCVGFTASCKYNGSLIVLALLAAHFLRYGKASLKQPKLYLAILLCVLGFLLTTPYAILDPLPFMEALKFEAQHYATGHAGMDGDTLIWYLNYMWTTGGVLYLLAALGILVGFILRPKETTLLSIFPLAYFVFINSFAVRNGRTFLPSTPYFIILAAGFLVFLHDKLKMLSMTPRRWLSMTLFVLLALGSLAIPLIKTITVTQQLVTLDSRETARLWIDENLPTGSKIALEAYSPFVEPSRFTVLGLDRIIEHDPAWYLEQGIDYLVFSQGMYGRFFAEPQRYPDETSQYEAFFERFQLVKLFTDGDFEVRLHQVR